MMESPDVDCYPWRGGLNDNPVQRHSRGFQMLGLKGQLEDERGSFSEPFALRS